MKNIVVFLLFMFFSTNSFSSETSFHDFSVESIEGKEVKWMEVIANDVRFLGKPSDAKSSSSTAEFATSDEDEQFSL